MEKVINTVKFINDIISLLETIEKDCKDFIRTKLLFDINYYSFILHKLTKMGCYTLSYEFVTEICGKPISDNNYYIFYDIIKEDFTFLKGKEIKQLKVKNFKNSLLELVNSDDSFVLDMISIENRLVKIPEILNKINHYDLKNVAKIVSSYYNEFKKIALSKQNKQHILLQTSYLIGNKANKDLYQNHDKHLLLSIQILLIQEICGFYENKKLLAIDYINNIKKQIIEKFISYELLNMAQYFHIYENDILNITDESFKYIYIDFEFDELVKLLLFIDIIDAIDKI